MKPALILAFKRPLFAVLIAQISTFSMPSSAQNLEETSQNTLKLEEVKTGPRQAPGQEVDELITNRKMRAETGSKSRYSISMGLGYSGGTLEKPLDENRPNISRGTGSTDFAALNGSVSGKYAIRSTHAILAGTGLRWVTPFNSSKTPAGYQGDKVDVSNPYATYQYLYNWLGIQAAVQANLTYFTASNLVRDGYVTTFGLSQNSAYQIPTTPVTIGAHAYVGYGYFDDNSAQARLNQSDYSVGFSPFLEYQITDRVNMRTGSNLFIYQHKRSEPAANTYKRQKVTQNLGLGISITRNIFLSPGLDFVIGDIRSDRTVVSLGANINLF